MNKNVPKLIAVSTIFILLLLFIYFTMNRQIDSPEIVNGYVDLSSYHPRDILVELNGPWRTEMFETVQIPEALYSGDNKEFTASITVKLPTKKSWYAIIIPRISGSYSVTVNGRPINATGFYAKVPTTIPTVTNYDFFSATNMVTIRIKCRPIYDGMSKTHPIILGSRISTHSEFARVMGLDMFIFVCLVFFTFLYFSTGHRKFFAVNATPIIFLSLGALLRCITTNGMLIGVLMPFLKYQLLYIFYPLSMFLYLGGLIGFTFYTIRLRRKKQNFHQSQLIGLFILYGATAYDLLSYGNIFGYGYGILAGTIALLVIMCMINYSEVSDIYNAEFQLNLSYEASIKALQREKNNYLSAHLKPHFLFNALNIISGYALFDQEKAKKVCDSLSTYMREFFDNCDLNAMNNLSDEIELLKAFGYIEQERFPEIKIAINIPKKIPNITVPALIFQPLLENAVNHGIRKKQSHCSGNVTATVKYDKKYLTFIIEDDGMGFSKEAFDKIRNNNSDTEYDCSICTINKRLKALYNEQLDIKTAPDKGSVVSLRIPLKREPNKVR